MPLSAAWEDYRRRLRLAVLVPAIGLGVSGALGVAVEYLGGPAFVFYAAAALTMVASLVAWARFVTFPCPRCGSWFASTPMFSNPLTDRCLHCGFGKWQYVHYARSTSSKTPRPGA